jgi:sugar phosphate permease
VTGVQTCALPIWLSFLATAGTAVLMAAPAQALTTRIGVKPVLVTGLVLLTLAVLWYTQISPGGSYLVDCLPGFVVFGIGIPFSFIPINITALAGVEEREAGLASGMINTSQQIGGAIGVAVMSTVAFTHAETLLRTGDPQPVAITEGFQWGFWVVFAILTACVLTTLALIRREEVRVEEVAAAAPG